jgi:peptidoglycan/xylan/chitin deacetylase (PgdA/CDA1 family)
VASAPQTDAHYWPACWERLAWWPPDAWTTITPDQYLAHLTAGAPLPRKPVILSFDDGSAGQAKEGLRMPNAT